MCAQDHLGKQWDQPELTFQVHRGLTRKPKPGKKLGMHWSADPSVARRFAGQFGTVIHGEVPISAVETDSRKLFRAGVFDKDNEAERPEKEIPVKSDANVTVTGTTGGGILHDPKWLGDIEEPAWRSHAYNRIKTRKRTRTYKKPRQAKA